MQTEPSIRLDADNTMDVREVPCSIKHGHIFQTCRELAIGKFFILRNGHEPARLRDQLEVQYPGAFLWECLRREPDDVTMRITKLRATTTTGDVPSCHGH